MCGIAGVMGQAGAVDLRDAVSRMARRLGHRGPDGHGVWASPSMTAVLAHTRLAVFDPSPRAAQPLSIDDGRLTITYNGALYNMVTLRDELRAAGEAFHTGSDTEVIVRAYWRYGTQCLDRFRGMFALAIWDEQAQTGMLARDPFGLKPLYYAVRDGRVIFASELRAIAASGLAGGELDAAAMHGYFQQGAVPEPHTLLRGVRMLPAGAFACWRRGDLAVTPARHEPWRSDAPAAARDAAAVTREALADSVQHHFAGDAAVGVLLSGGADSAAILALAARSGRTGVATFSLAFPGERTDEGAAAARTATAFGAAHHRLDVDAVTARRALADYSRAIDQPTIDGLNTFVAARFAHDHGIKVLLSGVGADELFGGYPSFTRVPALAAWHRAAAIAGPVTTWIGRSIERAAPGPRLRRVGDLLSQPPSLARAHAAFRGIFTRREAAALTRHYAGADSPAPDTIVALAADARESISVLEMSAYARNQLLRDADVMAMASGVEVRTPFMDRVLVSALWSIAPAVRLRAGKRLLAEAVPEVPTGAFALPKGCFQFPFERWIDGDWRDAFAGVTESSPVRLETWYRQWAVYSMEQALRNLNEARHA